MSLKSAILPFYRAFKLSLRYPLPSRARVVLDYLSLYYRKRLTPEEYYDFKFDKASNAFRDSFLGLNEQHFYLDYLNPIKYYSLARNKYLTHKLLDNTGVRKTNLYCYYQPEARIMVSDECAYSLDGVLRILKQRVVQSCVIKTTESSHGDNVLVVYSIEYQERDAILTCFNGEKLALSAILGQEALIFESVVHQTKQFASFNESSVNTIRFMTTLWPDGSARVIATFCKIGRAGKCVDNAGSGGNVDAGIDLETGKIQDVIQFDGWRKTKAIDRHPDNDSLLEGVIVDKWDSIKSEVIKYQQSFPYCKACGWDIAITDDGPVVIEINDFWDRTGQFFIKKGWRNEIRDCYLAWKKTGKKYATGELRLPIMDKKLIQLFT